MFASISLLLSSQPTCALHTTARTTPSSVHVRPGRTGTNEQLGQVQLRFSPPLCRMGTLRNILDYFWTTLLSLTCSEAMLHTLYIHVSYSSTGACTLSHMLAEFKHKLLIELYIMYTYVITHVNSPIQQTHRHSYHTSLYRVLMNCYYYYINYTLLLDSTGPILCFKNGHCLFFLSFLCV